MAAPSEGERPRSNAKVCHLFSRLNTFRFDGLMKQLGIQRADRAERPALVLRGEIEISQLRIENADHAGAGCGSGQQIDRGKCAGADDEAR